MGGKSEKVAKYNEDLRAEVETTTQQAPRATVHASEWRKIMNGDPVEINPSIGEGQKIMTFEEWSRGWKRNDDFPDCARCGGTRTKEHHFVQVWCRGKKKWESETFCLECHTFTWRSYCDPDFQTPEDAEKARWEALVRGEPGEAAA